MLDDLKSIECRTTPERMGCILEKGLDDAHLSNEEKQYLLSGGLSELYSVLEFEQAAVPALDEETIAMLTERFIPRRAENSQSLDIWLRIKEIIETVQLSSDWITGSAAFASRDSNTSTISFQKKVGKLTIHLEIVRRDERLADINVKVTDNAETRGHVFDAELLKGDQCVEMIHTTKDTTASFYAVEIQDYILKVSDAKNEIASIALHMQT